MGNVAILGEEVKTSLNSRPCSVPDGIATFGELMSFMEKERVPPGHVITSIVIDGVTLDDEDEQQRLAVPIDGVQVVEFHSARTLDLAREGLEDATELLPALADDLAEAAVQIRSGSVQDGLGMFYECIGVVDWYVNLVTAIDIIFNQALQGYEDDGSNSADSLNPDEQIGGPEYSGDRTFASIDNLREKLLAMEEAQHNNDLLLLADLMEYEVLPIVRIWQRETPGLLARLNREGGQA